LVSHGKESEGMLHVIWFVTWHACDQYGSIIYFFKQYGSMIIMWCLVNMLV